MNKIVGILTIIYFTLYYWRAQGTKWGKVYMITDFCIIPILCVFVSGSLGCIWWVFWLFLMYNRPSEHPRISPTEREYIEKAIDIKQEVVSETVFV